MKILWEKKDLSFLSLVNVPIIQEAFSSHLPYPLIQCFSWHSHDTSLSLDSSHPSSLHASLSCCSWTRLLPGKNLHRSSCLSRVPSTTESSRTSSPSRFLSQPPARSGLRVPGRQYSALRPLDTGVASGLVMLVSASAYTSAQRPAPYTCSHAPHHAQHRPSLKLHSLSSWRSEAATRLLFPCSSVSSRGAAERHRL